MARRAGWQNLSRLRRKLRRMPETARAEVGDAIIDGAITIFKSIADEVPVDTGELKAALGLKFSKRAGVVEGAKIGYSPKISRRKWDRAGWRAHFVLFGTKGGTITRVIRRGDRRVKQRLRMPPKPANNFIARGANRVKDRVIARVDGAVIEALKKVAAEQ